MKPKDAPEGTSAWTMFMYVVVVGFILQSIGLMERPLPAPTPDMYSVSPSAHGYLPDARALYEAAIAPPPGYSDYYHLSSPYYIP